MNETERYQLLDEIGRGGMGVVYRARDTKLGREVALKLLPMALAQDTVVLRRFQQEAQLIAQLEHPHIVPIYDSGLRLEQPFLVMRFLRGGSLYDRLHANQIAPAQLWQAFHQIALALDATHLQHIIHRDVKPTNILFDEQGLAYVTDFGIAKALDATTQYTGSAIVGSPAYMSPEQFVGDSISGRTDQYSLAVVAFEALAGQLPFRGSTVQMMYGHLHEPSPIIHTINPNLPPAVSDVLQKGMAKNPMERYENLSQFVHALQDAAVALPVVPSLTPVIREPVSLPPIETPPPSPTTSSVQRRQLLYRQGLEAFEAKQWSEAAEFFRQILVLDPNHINAKQRYAEAQGYLGQNSLPSQYQPVSSKSVPLPSKPTMIRQPNPQWRYWLVGAAVLLLLTFVSLAWMGGAENNVEVPTAVADSAVLPTLPSTALVSTMAPTSVVLVNQSVSAPVDFGFAAHIYTIDGDYDLQSAERLQIIEGDLVVEALGTAVIVQTRFGATVKLDGTSLAGIRYDPRTQQFTVHCFRGRCSVTGDVEGQAILLAGQAVAVGSSGTPSTVFAAQNELFMALARGVVPSPTPTRRATATPTPTPTSTPRPTYTATPMATPTSPPAAPAQPQPQPNPPTAVPPAPPPESPITPIPPYPYP